ncbi:hypothetical protein GCM10028815_23290 [Mariniluteicoccus flavus]
MERLRRGLGQRKREVPQAPLHARTDDGIADALRHDEAHADGRGAVDLGYVNAPGVHHESGPTGAYALADSALEVQRRPHPKP